jgi:YHS domain-containing protein
MIRAFFVDFLLPILLFLLARSFLRAFLSGSTRTPPRDRPAPNAPPLQPGGELKRDPVCGTYVSTAVSVKRTVKGEVLHFCSEECRNRYGKPL